MTTDETFDWALHFLIDGDTPRKGEKLWRGEQGKSVPRPSDPNPTMDGITQQAYDRHRGEADHSVYEMTPGERDAIYFLDYWQPSGAGKLAAMDKPNLALCHFVTAVNTGLTPAAKMLQRAVRPAVGELLVDGKIGPKTLDACLAADDHEAAVKYTGQMVRHYRAIAAGRPDLAENLPGWLLRTTALQREIGLV